MHVLKLSSITWRQGDHVILKNIHWEIESGEHWAVIGVNGSGKTSLLNLINGYIWPTKGTVEVLGNRYGKTNLDETRRKIGWVSVSLADRMLVNHPHDRAIDIVVSGKFASIGMWAKKEEKDYQEAMAVLQFFKASELTEKPFQILSQGEKQRVLIARAWMARPKLLILDEPCTGLDLKNRELLLNAISELQNKAGCPALIHVTHHPEEVLPLFNRVLILKNGSVLAKGEKSRVLTGQNLSSAFDIDVDVIWHAGRPWVHVPGALAPTLPS